MRKILLVSSVAMIATGCATVTKQTISAQSAAVLKHQTITSTTRAVPSFTAFSPGNAVFGLIGGLAAVSNGNSIVAKNNVADPAPAIAAGLMAVLTNSHGTRVVTPAVAVSGDDPSQVANAARGAARFVLDVQTTGWTMLYFSSNWTHYHLMYSAKARLIDTETKNVVAEGVCKHFPESDVGAPTYDEFVDNQAAGLKKELALAADNCVQTLAAEMLLTKDLAHVGATRTPAVSDVAPTTPVARTVPAKELAKVASAPARDAAPVAPVRNVSAVALASPAPFVPVASVAPAPVAAAAPVTAAVPVAAAAPVVVAASVAAAPSVAEQGPADDNVTQSGVTTGEPAYRMQDQGAPAGPAAQFASDGIYERTLAQLRASHPQINPSSPWYKKDVVDWVMARKSEYVSGGMAHELALRRAVQNLDKD